MSNVVRMCSLCVQIEEKAQKDEAEIKVIGTVIFN